MEFDLIGIEQLREKFYTALKKEDPTFMLGNLDVETFKGIDEGIKEIFRYGSKFVPKNYLKEAKS